MSLEEEAKKFLEKRNTESDPDKLRQELIKLLEFFIEQLKKGGA
jgi:hypothetical protein